MISLKYVCSEFQLFHFAAWNLWSDETKAKFSQYPIPGGGRLAATLERKVTRFQDPPQTIWILDIVSSFTFQQMENSKYFQLNNQLNNL